MKLRKEIKNWDESQCWFCKNQPSSPSSKYVLALHRVIERKSSIVYGGTRYKQKYIKTRTGIPRCKYCQKKHDMATAGFIVLWLIFGTMIVIWWFSNETPTNKSTTSFENILGGAIILFMSYFVSAILTGIISVFTGLLWKSERIAKYCPSVIEFTSKGWKVGEKPLGTWLGKD